MTVLTVGSSLFCRLGVGDVVEDVDFVRFMIKFVTRVETREELIFDASVNSSTEKKNLNSCSHVSSVVLLCGGLLSIILWSSV